jgi:hypothetical protein
MPACAFCTGACLHSERLHRHASDHLRQHQYRRVHRALHPQGQRCHHLYRRQRPGVCQVQRPLVRAHPLRADERRRQHPSTRRRCVRCHGRQRRCVTLCHCRSMPPPSHRFSVWHHLTWLPLHARVHSHPHWHDLPCHLCRSGVRRQRAGRGHQRLHQRPAPARRLRLRHHVHAQVCPGLHRLRPRHLHMCRCRQRRHGAGLHVHLCGEQVRGQLRHAHGLQMRERQPQHGLQRWPRHERGSLHFPLPRIEVTSQRLRGLPG